MAERPIPQQTLREQFTHAEQLTKELIDHLEHSLLPKIHDLKKLTQSDLKGETHSEDVTMRNHASSVFDSARFAEDVGDKLTAYFTSIDQVVGGIIAPQ